MPTATLITGTGDFEARLRETDDGLEGVRSYRVDTPDFELALAAVGLPARGSAWSAQFPALLARGREPFRLGGTWTRVEVLYQSPALGGGGNAAVVVEVGKPFTSVRTGTTSQQVMFPVGAPPGQTALNQGRGLVIQVGTVDLVVSVAYLNSQLGLVPWAQMEDLHTLPAVNAAGASVPNYANTGLARSYLAGQLLYKGYEIEPAAGYFILRHTVGVARTWLYTDELVDSRLAKASTRDVAVYRSASFANLWPGA